MNRDAFLERVRQAVRRGNAFQVATHPVAAGTGYVGAGDDPMARMAAEVAGVGGVPHRALDYSEAASILTELLRAQSPRAALCWEHPVLDRLGLDQILEKLGIERVGHRELAPQTPGEQRAKMLSAEVGISSVEYAIAETGTLAVCARPGQERSASLLPPRYVTVVHRDQILPDLFDLFVRLEAAGLDNLPSNVTLITGPSKTGDIELQLTTGVHGPGEWHVILVER
jgi:L-lactate dehydrogenase complex protein LldG